jgi:PAS domain S-box-containing protein
MLQPASELLEAALDAMIAVRQDGTVSFANGRTETIFEYTRPELLGQPIELLIPERLKTNHVGHMSAFFAAPRIRRMGAGISLFGRHRDGAEFPIEVSLSPVEVEGEQLVLAAVRDVTDRKQLEATVEESRAQMIASSRLSALGGMAGRIAHEISNPLAVIHGLASELAEQIDVEPEEAAQLGQQIAQYADRIAKIITSLRRIARDSDKDPFEEASIAGIIEQTLDLCKERFNQHSVELTATPIDPSIRIPCREVQISQVLVNLLQNAFDAAQEQSDEHWVRLETTVGDDRVIFSVIDSGRGVLPNLRQRIMDPFFTTKPVGKGTGLGLSMSKQIAEEHGGALRLEESAGNTRFSLQLPLSGKGRLICN